MSEAAISSSPSFLRKSADLGRELIIEPFSNLLKWSHRIAYPATSPEGELAKIRGLAETGIDRAAKQGVKADPLPSQLLTRLDRLSAQQKPVVRPASDRPSARPIDSKSLKSLERTRPLSLQACIEASDWKEQMRLNRIDLTKKLSDFTALLQMRNACGIPEKDNLVLINLIKKMGSIGKNASLWKTFTGCYSLSFFQKVKAAWVYLFYYQTSLISNTVGAYLKSFIDHLTKDLTTEKSDARSLFFAQCLQIANVFFSSDLRATLDFAEGKGEGDLDKQRDTAIEKRYNPTLKDHNAALKDLCKAASERQISKAPPWVSFFGSLQNILILGWIFQAFEWFVNRFIIQKAMKSSILPDILESAVTEGLEAAQPHRLPFTLGLTKFFTSQLVKLLKELDKENDETSKSIDEVSGTELLSTVTKHLKQVLSLEPYGTADELNKKLAEKEGWLKERASFRKMIEKSIEQGIVDGGNLLFGYLNETAKSGELFAHLLELSTEPFSGEIKDTETLKAEYKKEYLKFEQAGTDVLKKIIRLAVAKKVDGDQSKNRPKTAQTAFESWQAMAQETVGKLDELCKRMDAKIERRSPAPKNSIHTEIASFLEIMEIFANREELQIGIQNLQPAYRDSVWRIVTPIYEKAAMIEKRVVDHLQQLQDDYPADATVETLLQSSQDLLKSMLGQFLAHPESLLNPSIQMFDTLAKQTAKYLGKETDRSLHLNAFVKQISIASESLTAEQKTLAALEALYPARTEKIAPKKRGLLDHLIDCERGVPPPGFKPSACRTEMKKWLTHFSKEEQRELELLIGNGSNLRSKWRPLSIALQRMYQKHMDLKSRNQQLLEDTLKTALKWTQDEAAKYTSAKNQDHSAMQTQIKAVSSEIAALRKEIEVAKPSMPYSLTPLATKMTFGAWATAFTAAGSFLGPIGTTLGAVGGAVLAARYQKKATQPIADASMTPLPPLLNASLWTSGGIAASCLLPGPWAYIAGGTTAGLVGRTTREIAISQVEKYIFNKAWDIFKSGYRLVRAPRIYKGFATAALLVAAGKK